MNNVELKRYSIDGHNVTYREDPDGELVMFDECEKLRAQIEAQLADLSSGRKQDKADYLRQIKAYRAKVKELRELLKDIKPVFVSAYSEAVDDLRARIDKALSGG
jgi:hypothetical protein